MYRTFYSEGEDADLKAFNEMTPILDNALFKHIVEQARLEVYKQVHDEESAKHVFHVMKGFEILEQALNSPITNHSFAEKNG